MLNKIFTFLFETFPTWYVEYAQRKSSDWGIIEPLVPSLDHSITEVPIVVVPEAIVKPVEAGLLWDTPKHAWHSTRVIMDELGLSVDQKNLLCACIYQESEFYKGAIGKPNYDDSQDFGLCQYNNGNIKGIPLWIGQGATFASVDEVLNDPEKNVRVMIKTWKAGHLNWWASYKYGAYKQWLPKTSAMWLLAKGG